MSESVLVTGGTGKTGRYVVDGLKAKGAGVNAASRKGTGGGVVFDWDKPDTWELAIAGCKAAYLVAPPAKPEPAGVMIDFIQQATEAGMKRFVLLSSSLLPAGGPAMGQVHQWLLDSAVEWTVLRPSWFMENFSEGQHQPTIANERKIYSATGSGQVGFIGASDIAASAVQALTVAEPFNTDVILTGPERHSYDDIARILSELLGEQVVHEHQNAQEMTDRFVDAGVPAQSATMLAGMDQLIAQGAEARTTDVVERLAGHPPESFEHFARTNLSAWQ